MKLWNTLISVIFISILSLGVVFGGAVESSSVELMNELTKVKGTYVKLETQIDGKALKTDVSGFATIQSGTEVVYVPISTIYRSLGAKVEWDDKTKRLTIVEGNNTIFIDIGKSYITINGQEKEIEGSAPVLLMTYAGTPRTMAPLNVFKHLNLSETYVPETKIVTLRTGTNPASTSDTVPEISESVTGDASTPVETTTTTTTPVTPTKPKNMVEGVTYITNGKYQEIRIKSNVESANKNYMIDATPYGGKSRVVIDFQNTVLSPEAVVSVPGDGVQVKKIDLVTRTSPSLKVRAEIELTSPRGFYSYYDKVNQEQVVILVNTLRDLQYEKVGKDDVFNVITLARPNYVVRKLPGKLVLDLQDTKLNINGKSVGEKTVQKSGLLTAAYSQYTNPSEYSADQMVTRVVLNFSNDTLRDAAFIKETSEGLKVYLSGDPDKGLSYNKLSASAAQFSLKLSSEAKITKVLNNETNELVLMIPKEAISLENLSRTYQDGLVQSIAINASEDPTHYKVSINFTVGTLIYDNSVGTAISIAFINDGTLNTGEKKKRIVLDPGHGGSDPGAIGKTTLVKEKEMALKATNALKTELEKLGYEVVLSRSNDTKVELYQRTDFANEINADLFVSIHYNSSTDSKPKGVEIYYYPDAKGEREALAKSIFAPLVGKTGAIARGTKASTGLVVTRESAMTSVLIEMGFLSNPAEEQLVQKTDYMIVQTKAIAEGIKNYLQGR